MFYHNSRPAHTHTRTAQRRMNKKATRRCSATHHPSRAQRLRFLCLSHHPYVSISLKHPFDDQLFNRKSGRECRKTMDKLTDSRINQTGKSRSRARSRAEGAASSPRRPWHSRRAAHCYVLQCAIASLVVLPGIGNEIRTLSSGQLAANEAERRERRTRTQSPPQLRTTALHVRRSRGQKSLYWSLPRETIL